MLLTARYDSEEQSSFAGRVHDLPELRIRVKRGYNADPTHS